MGRFGALIRPTLSTGRFVPVRRCRTGRPGGTCQADDKEQADDDPGWTRNRHDHGGSLTITNPYNARKGIEMVVRALQPRVPS